MVVVNINLMPPKLLEERLVYGLKVFLGYQRTLDLRIVQTLEGKNNQRKKCENLCSSGKKRCVT